MLPLASRDIKLSVEEMISLEMLQRGKTQKLRIKSEGAGRRVGMREREGGHKI